MIKETLVNPNVGALELACKLWEQVHGYWPRVTAKIIANGDKIYTVTLRTTD